MISAAALCLTVASQIARIPADRFTLAWQHTVEKVAWEEDYRVAGAWLFLIAARIQGSGAGMEPPEDAVLERGIWHYRPQQRWYRSISLAASEFGGDYQICISGRCAALSTYLPARRGPVTLAPCPASGF